MSEEKKEEKKGKKSSTLKVTHQDAQKKVFDEVANEVTKDTVQASVADGSIKLSEESEATSKFKCDLCDFESISRGTKATHQKKAPNITGRWN